MRHAFLVLLLSTFYVGDAEAQTVRDIANRGACSTAGVEAISAQLAETQRCMNPSAFVRFAPHPGITLSSGRVHPYAQASARDALHRVAAEVPLTINSAFRTVADQYVLFNSGGCALAAVPGRSNHQSGRAVDVNNHGQARSTLQAQGCAWLGERDRVHFDCPGSDLRSDSVRAFQRLWNVNNPGDTIAEDGIYGNQTGSRLASTPAAGFPMDACDEEPPPPAGGRLRGVVYSNGDTEMRVPGANVRIVETDETMTAAGDGSWAFELDPGEYTVEVMAEGFATGRRSCMVATSEVWCSVGLTAGEPAMDGTLRGSLFVDDGGGMMGMAIADGRAVVVESGMSTSTGADGTWTMTLAAGTYTVIGSADGYASVTRSCEVIAGTETECPIGLASEGDVGTLQGVIFTDGDIYQRVIGATVRIVETSAETLSREGDGLFTFEVPPGTYTVEAGGPGFETDTRECVVEEGGVVWCSIGLERDGMGGGLTVEMAGEEEAAELPEEELERANAISGGCAVGTTRRPGPLPLLGLIIGLALLHRRR